MKYCLLIPHYNHERQFLAFLPKLLELGHHCLIVDDGSEADSLQKIKEFVVGNEQITLVEHAHNRGKGAAVTTGFYHARALGYTHVVQIDADGQHDFADIEKFIEQSRFLPDKIICGRPTFDESAPKVRLYGRRVTDFWVALETLSLKIKDGLCGFRVYPLTQMEHILDAYYIGARMDFDTEILVKAVWLNIDLHFIDTEVIYPEESVSHFNYMRDNLLLIRLHTRLMTGMLLRAPFILYRRLAG